MAGPNERALYAIEHGYTLTTRGPTPFSEAVKVMHPEPTSVLVVVSSFNRHEVLAACIRSLDQSIRIAGVSAKLLVVDSSVSPPEPPSVEGLLDIIVHRTDRDLYWAESMRLGVDIDSLGPSSYLMFLNEDVVLHPDSVRQMLAASVTKRAQVVVGTCQSSSGQLTYGAYSVKSRIFPLLLEPLDDPSGQVDTFNGNIVLLSADLISFIDSSFRLYRHRRADIDLGLTLSKAGVKMIRIAGFQGICETNSSYLLDPRLISLQEFLKQALGPKGVPVKEHFTFCRRNAGPFWILFFFATYVRLFLGLLTRKKVEM